MTNRRVRCWEGWRECVLTPVRTASAMRASETPCSCSAEHVRSGFPSGRRRCCSAPDATAPSSTRAMMAMPQNSATNCGEHRSPGRPRLPGREGLPHTCRLATAALADPSRSRSQRRTRTSLNNEGRPTAGTGDCGGTTLALLICLRPGVAKRCRAQPWECVADLVGAGASGSGEQAGAHERPSGGPA